MINLYQPSNSTSQTPERIGKIPSIPTIFPNNSQPGPLRNIGLRSGRKVPMPNKDYLRQIQDKAKVQRKENNKKSWDILAPGGSKSA